VTKLAQLIATWFYLGYLKGPGTAGTVAALAIAWLLHRFVGFNAAQFGLLALIGLFPAIWAADVTAGTSGVKDPQIVVVDEVIGMWLTLVGVDEFNWKSWLAAFALFRALDIGKPWPVREFEKFPGGAGILADDVAAALLAALVLFIAGWFNLY
jgi:phosphatidylglycerophosphatase A